MKISTTISGFSRLFDNDLSRVLDAARVIDASGADQLVLADHVVMGDRLDRYPFGTFPYGADEPWPEPLTLLAAIAAVTSNVRLGTGILITPLRPTALLAKTVATLDQISNGRVDLGIGTGWQREEYTASNIPWADRWKLLDDGIAACAQLWTQPAPVTFTSETVNFGPTWCLPQPKQQSAHTGIPVWYGVAAAPQHIDRIAKYATGWLPIHTTDNDGLKANIATLRAAVELHGRDPQSFQVRCAAKVVTGDDGHIDKVGTLAANAWLVDAGVTCASVGTGRHVRDAVSLERFLADAVAVFSDLG